MTNPDAFIDNTIALGHQIGRALTREQILGWRLADLEAFRTEADAWIDAHREAARMTAGPCN